MRHHTKARSIGIRPEAALREPAHIFVANHSYGAEVASIPLSTVAENHFERCCTTKSGSCVEHIVHSITNTSPKAARHTVRIVGRAGQFACGFILMLLVAVG